MVIFINFLLLYTMMIMMMT